MAPPLHRPYRIPAAYVWDPEADEWTPWAPVEAWAGHHHRRDRLEAEEAAILAAGGRWYAPWT